MKRINSFNHADSACEFRYIDSSTQLAWREWREAVCRRKGDVAGLTLILRACEENNMDLSDLVAMTDGQRDQIMNALYERMDRESGYVEAAA